MTRRPTPGPWRVLPNPPLDVETVDRIEIVDDDGFSIAELTASALRPDWHERYPDMPHWARGAEDGRTLRERPGGEVIANAELVAAAPDLRDALEAFMAASSALRIYEGTSDELRAKKEYTQAFNAARTALAKAAPQQTQEDPA